MWPKEISRDTLVYLLEEYTEWLAMQDPDEIRQISYPEEWVDLQDSDPCWLDRWPDNL